MRPQQVPTVLEEARCPRVGENLSPLAYFPERSAVTAWAWHTRDAVDSRLTIGLPKWPIVLISVAEFVAVRTVARRVPCGNCMPGRNQGEGNEVRADAGPLRRGLQRWSAVATWARRTRDAVDSRLSLPIGLRLTTG